MSSCRSQAYVTDRLGLQGTWATGDKCIQRPGRKHWRVKPPRISRCKQQNNIKTNFKEIWLQSVDRMHLAQDRFQWQAPVNAATNLTEFYKSWPTFFTSLLIINFSKGCLFHDLPSQLGHPHVERCQALPPRAQIRSITIYSSLTSKVTQMSD